MVSYISCSSYLDIGKLKYLYRERIEQERLKRYAHLDLFIGSLESEQDFYYDLDSFLKIEGSYLALFIENDRYISTLRLEKFEDGILIAGFETDPEYRGNGYGKALLQAVCCDLSRNTDKRFYSHVEKNNVISLYVHEICGFKIISDSALMIDGSNSDNHYTLVYKNDR